MKSIADPFINRPVMTMLVYLAIGVFGVYSYLAMPVSDLPTVDYPIIKVSVNYPGASPEVMAHNVASPLEQQFLQIPGIELVASNNSLGNSQITLQFNLDKSIDGAASDVQSAIAAAAGHAAARFAVAADVPKGESQRSAGHFLWDDFVYDDGGAVV